MSNKYIFLLLLLACMIYPSTAWVDGYNSRMLHTITGSSSWVSDQSGYVVRFIVSNTSGAHSGENLYIQDCLPSWNDIKFTTNTSNTTLPAFKGYENATSAEIWVKIPTLYESGGTQIYIYYDNPSETKLSDNLPSTVCDHFDGDSFNTSMWITHWLSATIDDSTATLWWYYYGYTFSLQSVDSIYTRNSSVITRHYLENCAYPSAMEGKVGYNSYPYTIGGDDPAGIGGFRLNSSIFADITDSELETMNTWKITLNNTYAELYEGNSLKYADRNLSYSNSSTYMMFVGTYYRTYVDYVLVIPFVFPEPVHSTYGSAEYSNVTANFTASNTTGEAPFIVEFTDTSLNATSWAWDIDNDGVTDYTTQNCTHIYTTAGLYSVKLVASIGEFSDDELKTDYISVTGASTNYGSQYAPHTVRFMVQDFYGNPITNLNVVATPTTTSMGEWSWLQYLYGLDPHVDIENDVLTGITGADGSSSFVMLEAVGYSIRFYNTTQEIDHTELIFPQEQEYLIHIHTQNEMNYTPTSYFMWYDLNHTTESNESMTFFGYTNFSSNIVDNISFYVEWTNGTFLYTDFENNPTIESFQYNLPYAAGESVYYGFNITSYNYTNSSPVKAATFPDDIDWNIPSEYLGWAGAGLILLFAAIFTRGTIEIGLIVLPIVALLLTMMSMIPVTIGAPASVLLFLGVLIYIRSRYSG